MTHISIRLSDIKKGAAGTMAILPLHQDDVVQMKKPHPCGGDLFKILRVGSVVRVKCTTCGRDMTVERIKLEKSIRKICGQA